jgi:hypothetical protein
MTAATETSSPSRAAPFFEALYEAYQRAAAGGESALHWRIAGMQVEGRFAGDTLRDRLTPVLAHLRTVETITPELTVCHFDSAATGVEPPHFSWDYYRDLYTDDYGSQGEIAGLNDGRYSVIHQQWSDELYALDRARGLAFHWVASAERLPYYAGAFSLRLPLHLWTRDKAIQLLHAGAIGTDSAAALLIGVSGAGKSTSALACLDGGMRYLADDYAAVEFGETTMVHSLYSVAKLNADNLFRFPRLAEQVINPEHGESEKAVIVLDPAQTSTEPLPLKAILMPKVTGVGDTRIVPGSRAKALLALAPTTLFQVIGHKVLTFEKLRRLVRTVPVYTLEAGTDLSQIPLVIKEFLKA